MSDFSIPLVGELAPWFEGQALGGSPNYGFSSVGGRAVLLVFFGSMTWEPCQVAQQQILAQRGLFDDLQATFFGVSIDPSDVSKARIRRDIPGIRYFLDPNRNISRRYGSSPLAQDDMRYVPRIFVLDKQMRVRGLFAISDAEGALKTLKTLIDTPDTQTFAPILIIPNVFEPDLCARLIAHFDSTGGEESGSMIERDGRTICVMNHQHKRRHDSVIPDGPLKLATLERLSHRVVPMVARCFNFHTTKIERTLVSCYDSADAGHFAPHRDNTTPGTAHRGFAVSINLNTDDYEGGELRFPEFGGQTYRAPTGAAVVFGCSVLHEARPVTAGRRFAFVPFFYDRAGAALRAANAHLVQDGTVPQPTKIRATKGRRR
jgi:predicted 2-oxoglutarate/Fe(II)-dependent dioxygenase YbiX/peroxiredoxin